jgi:divalent metal cation (Fe/Co/Zn/Cd) transporter
LRDLQEPGRRIPRRSLELFDEGCEIRPLLARRDAGSMGGPWDNWTMHESTLPIAPLAATRDHWVRRARQLAWLGVGWHGLEAAVAIGAGLAAGSIALIGFGADSLVESLAGFILLWRFAGRRASSNIAERRAQKLIALSFYLIAVYVGLEATHTVVAVDRPHVSWVGIALSVVTLLTMPPLALAKAHVGDRLGSSATKSEGRQNMLCAYLSAALLVGLGANAAAGWWWADPAAAFVIAAVAIHEGRKAWRGESCCDDPSCS